MKTKYIIEQEIIGLEEAIVSGYFELNESYVGEKIWSTLKNLDKDDMLSLLDSFLHNGKPQSGFVELYEDTILIPYGEIEIEEDVYDLLPENEKGDWYLSGDGYAYLELQVVQWFLSNGQIEELNLGAWEFYPKAFGFSESYVYDFPGYALSALINDDYSDLEKEDIENLKTFIEKEDYINHFEVVGETYFCNQPEFGLACDCVKVIGFVK